MTKDKLLYQLPKVIIFFWLLTLFACNSSSNCECSSFKEIPQSTKDWFYFKDSSYWVFRMLEDTTQIDTIIQTLVKDHSIYIKCETSYNGAMNCSEMRTIFYTHSNSKLFPSYNSNKSNLGFHYFIIYSPGKNSEVLNLYSSTPNLSLNGQLVMFPLKLNNQIGYYIISDSIENYTINNLKFKSTTLKIKSNISAQIDNIITEVWWTKGVGMVKYIKSEGNTPKATWELVDYKLQ